MFTNLMADLLLLIITFPALIQADFELTDINFPFFETAQKLLDLPDNSSALLIIQLQSLNIFRNFSAILINLIRILCYRSFADELFLLFFKLQIFLIKLGNLIHDT